MPELNTEFIDLEIDDNVGDEDEVNISYDVTTYPSDLRLDGIKKMWDNKDIIIPDFQREFVWKLKQSSLLIESFLLGLPVPPVFFYVDDENKNLVIDGQQRLLSIFFFLEGYFGFEIQQKRQVFRLQGLDEKSPYYKKTFKELDDISRRKLEGSVLRAINVRQLSPADGNTSMYHIFERLNTGGTPLKQQEIRNCVFRGDFVGVLKTLNIDMNWRKIIGKDALDRHQKDVELILRLFALYKNIANYERPMKEFLNKAMDKNKTGKTPKVKEFCENFSVATELIVRLFGHKPFHLRGPLNAAALESVFVVILENLDKLPNDIADRFKKLKKDNEFGDLTLRATSNVKITEDRYELVKKILLS